MKKKVFGRKLSREKSSRKALFRSLVRSFILGGKIETTKAKALSMLPLLEDVIGKARNPNLSVRRNLIAEVGGDRKVVEKLIKETGERFKDKVSGFVRIYSLPRRRGDGAEMARVEWSQEAAKEIRPAPAESSSDAKKKNFTSPRFRGAKEVKTK